MGPSLAPYLDVAKNAKAFVTFSDQPHPRHISAKLKEGVFGFDDLAWLENDFRHIPKINDELYGVLWKSSNGSAITITCWTISSRVLFTLGRTGKRARMSRSWQTCLKSTGQLRESS